MRSASSRKRQRPDRSVTERFSSFLWKTPSESGPARQARTPFSKAHDLSLRRAENGENELIALFSAGVGSEAFQDSCTEIMDHYFRRCVQESETGQRLFRDKKPFALVALGGYGRKDLCIHSDIDVLILFDAKVPSSAKNWQRMSFILYGIWASTWDMQYEALRTVSTLRVKSPKP